MRAEELSPAGADYVKVGDGSVRKGTVAAFAQNALTLERADRSSEQYAQALVDLHATAEQLADTGFFEVFGVRPEVAPTAFEYVAGVVLARD